MKSETSTSALPSETREEQIARITAVMSQDEEYIASHRAMPLPETPIEPFLEALQKRDLPALFAQWYAKRTEEDPESYPPALTGAEWFTAFADFVEGLAYQPTEAPRGNIGFGGYNLG